MRIEHVALWTENPDRLVRYYSRYFNAEVGRRYVNKAKGFESRFLKFDDGARLEVMKTTTLSPLQAEYGAERMGLTHIALSVGSETAVDNLTRTLQNDGYPILDGPRRTGDGYYESVTLDPDGNRLELTV